MWRLAFYGHMVAMMFLAAPHLISAMALFGIALAPATAFFVYFLWWLVRLYPESPIAELREMGVRSFIRAFDRSSLFVGSTMFLTQLAPVKMRIADHFWADPYLMAFDRSIFGVDASTLTHWLAEPLTPFIDVFYSAWVFVLVIASMLVAMFASEKKLAKFFLGIACCWTLLGVVLAFGLASAGPIFGPDFGFGFAHLHEQLRTAPLTMVGHDVLMKAFFLRVPRFGAGISAAPSLHCAIVFLLAFAAYGTRLFIPSVIYAGMIWFSSVHLGWHYFADGLISLIAVTAIWTALDLLIQLDRYAHLPGHVGFDGRKLASTEHRVAAK